MSETRDDFDANVVLIFIRRIWIKFSNSYVKIFIQMKTLSTLNISNYRDLIYKENQLLQHELNYGMTPVHLFLFTSQDRRITIL